MMQKRLIVLILLAAASASIADAQVTKKAPRTHSTSREDSAERLPFAEARNIAVIVLSVPPHSIPTPVGSGVWIGKQGYVATCQHVVAGSPGPFKIGIADEPYFAEGSANISITSSATVIDVDVIDSDPATDVAILKAHSTPEAVQISPLASGNLPRSLTPQTRISPKGATLNTNFPEAGRTLLLAGFPLGENTLVLQVGIMTGFLSIPKTPNVLPASTLRMMLSLVSNPGNSGGPVLDTNGHVVGLLEGNLMSPVKSDQYGPEYCTRVSLGTDGQPLRDASGNVKFEPIQCMQNSGISYAVPAKSIMDLAKRKNLSLN